MACENILQIPRPEHPNPQWERKHWKNLNGTWEFEFDFGCSAVGRKVMQKMTGMTKFGFSAESLRR